MGEGTWYYNSFPLYDFCEKDSGKIISTWVKDGRNNILVLTNSTHSHYLSTRIEMLGFQKNNNLKIYRTKFSLQHENRQP